MLGHKAAFALGVIWLAAAATRTLAQEDATVAAPPTFNRDIAPIVFARCASCHRPGEVGPFPLLTYDQVRKRGKLIQELTASRQMPPWKSHPADGPFIGERRLSDDQIASIADWVSQGMPEGDAADLPPQPQFASGWKLGEPDIVFTMPEAYQIPAEGADIYRNFVVPLSVPVGKFIKALEFRPQNRAVVHHTVFATDPTGRGRERDAADPMPGFSGDINLAGRMLPGELAIWVPGRDPLPLPEGFSFHWPDGADLIMQLHLHPSGKPESEQSSVGVYLSDEPSRRSMLDLTLIDMKIDIPPGEREYRTKSELIVPAEVEVFGIFPHMHLIGREINVTAHPPEGGPQTLLRIDDWDFNWQSSYQFVHPVRLAAGTRLVMDARHDNSAENFRNPFQPPQRVRWGEQTTDEMSLAFMQVVPVNEADLEQLTGSGDRLRVSIVAGGGPAPVVAARGPNAARMFQQVDRDGNGQLSLDEIAAANNKTPEEMQPQLDRFDADKDGGINLEELTEALRVLTADRAGSRPEVAESPQPDNSVPAVADDRPQDFAALFTKFDTDGDGHLNLDEIAAANNKTSEEMRPQLERFDTDKDGVINRTEFDEAVSTLTKELAGAKAATQSADAEQLFQKIDTDGDGRLSLDEVAVANNKTREEMQPELERFDADKDGAISLPELQEALRTLVRP